jgi:glycolate oxidase iron-sulfur subunit
MQTNLLTDLLATEQGQTADSILRSCVHCGFCLSTCPTYGLLGDELDSPRGRIYLIKSVLEGNKVSSDSLNHLDRCLTCRSCETTCPSGVKYGQLLDIGREIMEQQSPRPFWQRTIRYLLRKSLTTAWLFNFGIMLAPFLRHSKAVKFSVEELSLQQQLQDQQDVIKHSVLLLSGCVQPALAPNINQATIKVLNRLALNVIETPQSACCGAVSHHLSGAEATHQQVKANIDSWLGYLDKGVQAIISNASGCGVMVKDYPNLFSKDSLYYKKALRVSKYTKDIAEFLVEKDLSSLMHFKNDTVTFHAPCTLQHGQKQPVLVQQILQKLGYQVNSVKDSHLCCGSAGTYSIFQPKISKQLRTNKLNNLLEHKTELIITANIGCLMHLQGGTKTPIKHWIELLA